MASLDSQRSSTSLMSLISDALLVAFTAVLAVVAVLQWIALRRTNQMSQVIQRAWVDVSPTPSGLTFQQRTSTVTNAHIDYQVKNNGHIPAEVLRKRRGVLRS